MHRRDFLKVLPAAFLSRSLLPTPAFADVPRGKKGDFGINLAGADYYTTEMPFANLATLASRWRLQKADQPFTWDLPLPPMTDDGYPSSVPEGSYIETFLLFTRFRNSLPPELFVTYEGEGKLEYSGGAKLVTRSPGVDQIRWLSTSDEPVTAQLVATNPSNPLRNLSLREVPGKASGQTFRQAFLDRNGSMSTVRFMDWMQTNNSKVEEFEQRPPKRRFTQAENGVALEYMVELANRLQTAPWFTLPHKATDDYVSRFAEMVRTSLDPTLPVYVEYSNEVWNGQFDQSEYAQAQGLRLGLSSDPYVAQLRFYSQRTSEVLKIWERVFADEKDRVVGVYATQADNEFSGETVLGWGDAMKYADVHAIAPYFGRQFGDPDTAGEVSKWSLDRLFDELGKEVDGSNKKMMESQAALAKRFGLKMMAYEGGQHLGGYNGAENDDRLTMLLVKANWDPRMGDLYRRYLANWKSAGGGTFVLYNSMGGYGKWGSWGLLENEDKQTSPKWEAVQSMMKV